MAGSAEARLELARAIRGVCPPQDTLATVDAVLAMPELVLAALGGVCERSATTRIGVIRTYTVTFERDDRPDCHKCHHAAHTGACLASNGRSTPPIFCGCEERN